MNPLKLRVVAASVLAGLVVLGAVICAALDLAVVAAALAIYALGAGAWLYHAIERYVVAKRVDTVIEANRLSPIRYAAKPLLPVMAAIIGLTQAVVRVLSDATELHERRDLGLRRPSLPALTRRSRTIDADEDS
ncbi:antitermination protein NusB [Mycobacterium hubeiense]|uniref:antitermination protein NusB n=1 Tax=Mycobacterium hubeiense TaxID=1867256 RepID=UPI000C7ECD7F|nr:antitermination protein NusB [Mycobacterium sp. QGD 101]